MALFRQAGYETRDNKLVNAKTGQQMRVEFLDDSQSMVRVVRPYVTGLQRVGIDATIRIVDSAQYQTRTDDFDFDAVMVFFNFFPPPGTEQRSYFGSAAADVKGSADYAGIKDPGRRCADRGSHPPRIMKSSRRPRGPLDRVLLWQHAIIPNGTTTRPGSPIGPSLAGRNRNPAMTPGSLPHGGRRRPRQPAVENVRTCREKTIMIPDPESSNLPAARRCRAQEARPTRATP